MFMFFTTFIRDYLESLNTLSWNFSNLAEVKILLISTFTYLAQCIKLSFIFIFSFQWLRDLVYLPLVLPTFLKEIISGNYILNDEFNFLQYSPITQNTQNVFILGFLNSFFLSLPISIPVLIIFRRLLIENLTAWFVTMLGTVMGQTTLLMCVMFGWRFIIFPWTSFEPFPAIIGLFLALILAHQFIDTTKPYEFSRKLLLQYFSLNFILVWTEQILFFPYLGNLGSIQTLLDVTEKSNTFVNLTYFVGFFVGSLIFLTLFSWIAFQIKKLIEYKSSLINVERKLNFLFSVGIISLSITTFPYYAFDYLVTSPLGFIVNDKALNPLVESCEKFVEKMPNQPLTREKDTKIMDFQAFTNKDRADDSPIEDLVYAGERRAMTKISRMGSINERNATEFTRYFVQKIVSVPSQTGQAYQTKTETSPLWEPDFATSFIPPSKYQEDPLKEEIQSVTDESLAGTELYKHLLQGNSFVDPNTNPGVLDPSMEQRSFKEQYYKNPVYKFLLTADVGNFISNQPKTYLLSEKEKRDIQSTRNALFAYGNSLRKYREMPNYEVFDKFFNGVKSYSNTIYNHQFNGTWTVIRRLFQLDPNRIESTNFVSYDQPLFYSEKERTSFQHEELDSLRKDLVQLKPMNPIPLYAGWEDDSKRFVLTTRFTDFKNTNTHFIQEDTNVSKKIFFTSWPIENIEKAQRSRVPYTGLTYTDFSPKFFKQLKDTFGIEKLSKKTLNTLPQNASRIYTLGEQDTVSARLPPQVGGWFWPGKPMIF
nr:Hypothetical protein Ycf1 [Pedinophyceae sp. YPF-701]